MVHYTHSQHRDLKRGPPWFILLALTFRICDIEQNSLSEPMFPYLKTGNSNRTHFVGFLWELMSAMHPKCWHCDIEQWMSFWRSWWLTGLCFWSQLTINLRHILWELINSVLCSSLLNPAQGAQEGRRKIDIKGTFHIEGSSVENVRQPVSC